MSTPTVRASELLLFGALPAAFAVLVFVAHGQIGALHFDFVGTVWEPTRAILDGRSPYPAPTAHGVDTGNPALYPPAVVLVGAPFAAFPYPVAAVLWTGALLAAVPASLLLLGVRDWRCHALALSSFPVLLAAAFGNVTLLLVAAVVVAWTFRDRPWAAGLAVGLAVALKLFLWPLALWLLATRRFAAAAIAFAAAVAAVFGPWAAIGFAGLAEYPDLLRAADDVFAARSNSLYAGALGVGLGEAAARGVTLAAGGALALACFAFARRGDGDRRALCAGIGAALVLSPIVWPHYFAFLLVAVALVVPRLHPLWLAAPVSTAIFFVLPAPRGTSAGRPADVPAEIWEPMHASSPAIWQTVGYTALLAAVLLVVLRRRAEPAS